MRFPLVKAEKAQQSVSDCAACSAPLVPADLWRVINGLHLGVDPSPSSAAVADPLLQLGRQQPSRAMWTYLIAHDVSAT